MSKFAYQYRFKAKEGEGKNLAEVLLQGEKLLAPVDSCLLYMVSIDQEKPDTVWVTEVWKTEEDHKNSIFLYGRSMIRRDYWKYMEDYRAKGKKLNVAGGYGI